MDTGCTDQVVLDRFVFSSIESCNRKKTVEIPTCALSGIEDKDSLEVEKKDCQDTVRNYLFDDVLLEPNHSGENLMKVSSVVATVSSFSFAADASHKLAPHGGQRFVKHSGKLLFTE